ncbi:MAG: WbuC family cupin fold metalloprotein [Hylemonella sp.]|uniref:WbuC family cupin fold metalloprotein n=1 Tax=Hylemonella sp. TaxID=2066020 RepID=UPI0022CC40BE|nr:WbuC family cupin fold metalloprotein [Hylemonella sp.]MCZ8253480.1 WbuC family cupin fold metalloprotein [Hylemonella sp.]
MMDAFRKVSDEVFVADTSIVQLGTEHIAFLKTQARTSSRKRSRICAHRSSEDALHEMLIAISADSYIHPHKHTRKVESFHIVEGMVDVVVFDDAGTIVDVVELGDITTGRNFYYRLSDSMFHTLLIYNDFLVVHEVTNGPFMANETILAPFAPPESQAGDARAYIASIRRAVEARGRHN